jgi:hypothetical protein
MSSRKLLLALFAIIVVIIGATISVVIFTNHNHAFQQQMIATPTSTAVRVASSTTDETAGWQTYTDTQEGLSFKYPSDWAVKKDSGNIYLYGTGTAYSSYNFGTIYISSSTATVSNLLGQQPLVECPSSTTAIQFNSYCLPVPNKNLQTVSGDTWTAVAVCIDAGDQFPADIPPSSCPNDFWAKANNLNYIFYYDHNGGPDYNNLDNFLRSWTFSAPKS